jgi:hypothetical protein
VAKVFLGLAGIRRHCGGGVMRALSYGEINLIHTYIFICLPLDLYRYGISHNNNNTVIIIIHKTKESSSFNITQ